MTTELRRIDVCALCADRRPPPELVMTCSRAHVHYLHAKCHEKLVRDFHKSLGRHARAGWHLFDPSALNLLLIIGIHSGQKPSSDRCEI